MDAITKRLLTEIAELGTQDLYTDAGEYQNRAGAMHELCALAGRAARGEELS